MLTKEDLQAIGALIKDSEERIRKDMVTKSDLEANNKVLGTIVRIELAEMNKRIDSVATAMKAGFQETFKQIRRVDEKLDNKTKDHGDRIEIIEEHVGLPHKN